MRVRKQSKVRERSVVFLVICEGETEREYVEKLKSHYRLPIMVKTKVVGTRINPRLVKQFIIDLDLSSDRLCRVFMVYDADVECIVDRLKEIDGTLILSNPCIELWFMLHGRDYHRHSHSEGIVMELKSSHGVWSNYTKGNLNDTQVKFLIGHRQEAIDRAKNLSWQENPSTNFYLLIEALEKIKSS